MRRVGAQQRKQVQHEGANHHAREPPAERPGPFVGGCPPPPEKRGQQPNTEQEQEHQGIGEDEFPELAGCPQIRFQPTVHDVPGQLQAEIVRPDRVGDAGHHRARLCIRERHHLEEVRRPHEG